ncbi:MAG: hypothetical protein JXR83_16275 [Deltaproteobacteria bacterium]|nr:hypothetical protein [Deltaproteobacteria bacterium]
MTPPDFDIAYVGHYTKDTVVTTSANRTQDGGAFYYGCGVALAMGKRAAVVTRLARADWHVVDRLSAAGVHMFARATPETTRLRLEYQTDDLDQRTIFNTGSAGPFTVDEVTPVRARHFHVCASIRGEVPLEVIDAIKAGGGRVSLDVQGYLRVNRGGRLQSEPWPEMAEVLRRVDVLKADAVEARELLGIDDLGAAAEKFAALGPAEVLLTHAGGVLAWADGRLHQAPFVAADLRGRTGRGDTCTSSYVLRRQERSPREAVIWAAALTSLKLEQPGPFARTVEDVERLIRERYTDPRAAATAP